MPQAEGGVEHARLTNREDACGESRPPSLPLGGR
jgi:hypothetical protein